MREPIILLQRINKSFRVGDDDVRILNDISLSVPTGQFLSIVGMSGNGKSTLLNMMTGIDRPTSGNVVVNGTELNRMSENKLAKWRGKNIGIIFQFFQLLPSLTLKQNVMLPMDFVGTIPRRRRADRAMMLLDRVGLSDQANKLPSMVSGGQKQRTAIARALANDPPLLVADEPTGNLDDATSEAIWNIFTQLQAAGKTIIMVTHNHELATRASRSIEIVSGQITNAPTPQRTVQREPLYFPNGARDVAHNNGANGLNGRTYRKLGVTQRVLLHPIPTG